MAKGSIPSAGSRQHGASAPGTGGPSGGETFGSIVVDHRRYPDMTLFLVCTVVPLLFGLWAQMKVKRTFARYAQVAPRNGLTGAQAAAAVLQSSGLPDLKIRPVAGQLTDHYDPRSRTLNLSADVGQASSLAALGVAAHEAGHAIQDARHYAPMRIRQTLVPAATIGQSLWFLPVVLGLILGLTGLVTVGLVLFAVIVLFQLVTLPVEFDASKRALVALQDNGLLAADEVPGARAVLNAAALTYVAGFVAALGQLVYFFGLSRQ
jgi:Zn-dependent membrane protease YugP